MAKHGTREAPPTTDLPVAAPTTSTVGTIGTFTTIEITKDYLHFSAAHFTIFSATRRENLHGHNFDVGCVIETPIGNDGLAFDYNLIKDKLKALCDELDERTLLPEQSPYLSFETEDDYLIAIFAEERIPFLRRDVLKLPIRNSTVEEFARWFVARLSNDSDFVQLPIRTMTVRVSSGPGQWAASRWENA
jgi:6-pyruvoyltetrahydropterin/6-carboxytetrahydropterin synthase